MSKTKLHELAEFGQSAWLDYIDRELLETDKLKNFIDQGLRGMTSNPSIFNNAISNSKDYDDKIVELKGQGKSTFEIYDELTIRDIQEACDQFKGVWDATDHLDGYVSLEINPELANDTETSITEGKRLFTKVKRPNVMIKVPATDAGFPVIEALIADGINVNVTLIFSQDQYIKTVRSYFAGLKKALAAGVDLRKIRSVASVFVSRIDTDIDKQLEEKAAKADSDESKKKLNQLRGKAAVANSRVVFQTSVEAFGSEEFKELFEKGANIQRVLWGSTSTKNPDYNDIKYVEELIAKQTVNTIPEKTLVAFIDHGKVKDAFADDAAKAQSTIHELNNSGIDVNEVCTRLLKDGVVAFEKAFSDLMNAIEVKAKQLTAA